MWEKIEIYQKYCLGNQFYHNHLEFDFINKNAKLISEEIIPGFIKSKKLFNNFENKEIAKSLIKSHLIDEKKLDDDDILSIKCDFKRFFDNYKEIDMDYYQGIGTIFHFIIKTISNDEIKEYYIINDFDYYFEDLADEIKYIFNIDLFNYDLTEKLISPYKYNIYHDGVFYKKTGEKLSLKKINFSVSSQSGSSNIILNSNDENFEYILGLLEKYRVYRWHDKDYLENIKYQEKFSENIENSWIIELIFENGCVLNLTGKNAYPDTYIGLGQELLKLTGNDYLKINDIPNSKRLIEYNNEKLAINDGQFDKITIRQYFNTEPHFYEEFIIDFKKQKAYWNIKDIFFKNLEEDRQFYNTPNNITFFIYEKLFSNVSSKMYELSKEKIDNFYEKFDFIESFPIYDENKRYYEREYLNSFISFEITSHHPYNKKRYYSVLEN